MLLGCFQTLAFAARVPARIHAVHMQLSATSGAVTPFEDWAEATGINAPKLAVIGREDLRGVVVLEDVKEGEELCCVPRTSCLDLSAVEGSGSPCEAFVPTSLWVTLRWYERLACWLLAEERRGQESPIVGYLGYLPRPESFANAPLVWTDDELAELCYPPVVVAVREQASELRALHAALEAKGPVTVTVNLASAQSAWSDSRASPILLTTMTMVFTPVRLRSTGSAGMPVCITLLFQRRFPSP
jgi:hypothetical protein